MMGRHSNPPLNIAVIIGSVRIGRAGPKSGGLVSRPRRGTARPSAQSCRPSLDYELSDAPLGPGIKAEPDQLRHIDALRIRLAEADGFVVVTPEYNRSYPASLKKAINQYNVEWRAKPVAFVSYGGISGGLRAVEHLRNVFAELHAVTVRTAVCVSELWKHFDHTGAFSPPSAAAIQNMLPELRWWADCLRHARKQTPYPQ